MSISRIDTIQHLNEVVRTIPCAVDGDPRKVAYIEVMIRFVPMAGLVALSIFVTPAAAQDRNGIRDRDQYYRLSPSSAHQYDNYTPPRIYYPRKDRDRMKVLPDPPQAPMASPEYGPPPKAIDRIPKT